VGEGMRGRMGVLYPGSATPGSGNRSCYWSWIGGGEGGKKKGKERKEEAVLVPFSVRGRQPAAVSNFLGTGGKGGEEAS